MLHVPSPQTRPLTQVKLQPPSSRKTMRRSAKHSRTYPAYCKVNRTNAEELYLGYLETIGSPIALSVWMLYKSGEHDQLVAKSIDPFNYNCGMSFRNDYAAVKFFSKTKGLKTTFNLKEVALASAVKAENLCRTTNERIRSYRSGSVRNPFASEFFRAQTIIASILGPLPREFEDVGWSPGRTSSSWGDEVASVYKYTSRLDTTWSAQHLSQKVVGSSYLWSQAALEADGPCSILRSALNIVPGNTMITVSKNAKTDRIICYEPHCNIRLQLPVGQYIQRRLKRVGVNLTDQSINQLRARLAAKYGELATIDLSMASDTLALELVYDLLPIEWAIYLDNIRSKNTLWPDGTWRKNEKFSSMGNGFTFELESLIFYALARAVSDNVSVFGDDIIVPTTDFDGVVSVLEAAGFVTNKQKSFSTGYFRESCGYDGFGSFDVTPVFLRSLIKNLEDVLKVHNRIREWSGRVKYPSLDFAKYLRRIRNSHTCHLGPSGYGDGHYHVNFEEACPERANHQLDGWWFKTYSTNFRVNKLYGDRVFGRFSGRYVPAALATATGPRRNFDTVQASTDRRLLSYSEVRILANFTWPSIVYW